MKKNAMVVLTELKASLGIAQTTVDLFNDLTDADQATFGDVETIRKLLVNLRSKELVENGASEIANGRTLLTWVITKSGLEALDKAYKDDIYKHFFPAESIDEVKERDEFVFNELVLRKNTDNDFKLIMLETMKKLNAIINECIEKLEGVK